MLSGSAALALLATGALTACGSVGEGVRLEGPPTAATGPDRLQASPGSATVAPSGRVTPPTPSGEGVGGSPGPQQKGGGFNPANEPDRVVALLRGDPKVSAGVKQVLQPCAGSWPMTVETGQATGPLGDVVVNVSSCADGVGVGTYVYRRSSSGALVNVFAAEGPPVRSTIEAGRLVVSRDVFLGDEPVCCPSGRDVVTYEWRNGVFRAVHRERVDAERAERGETVKRPAPRTSAPAG